MLSDSTVVSSRGGTRTFRSLQKLFVYLFIFGIFSLGAEGYLRLIFEDPSLNYLDSFDPYLQNQLDPNDTERHINRHGFRGEEITRYKPDGTLRVFVLGGSTVLSAEVAYEKSHVRLLELLLEGRSEGLALSANLGETRNE